MSEKIAIVTDHGSDLQEIPEIKGSKDIFFIPLYVNFGTESISSSDLSPQSFFERLANTTKQNYPSTAAGSIKDVVEIYEDVKEKGYTKVISIHPLTASRQIENARLAAEQVKNLDIEIINSQSVSVGQGASVLKAKSLLDQNFPFNEIVEEVNKFASSTKAYVSLKSLEYVVRGGRVTQRKYFLGRLLRVNPVLKLGQGEIITYQKAYGVKSSRNKAYDLATQDWNKNDNFKYIIAYANNKEVGEEFETKLKSEYPNADGYITPVGVIIGAHTGPGSLAMVTY